MFIQNIKLFFASLLSILLIFLIWKETYIYGCVILIFPLIVLLVISSSYIEIKMQDRMCFKNCYFNETSIFSKILSSRFMVTIFYFLVSLFMTISVMYAVIDYSLELWSYLIFHLFLVVILYKYLINLLSKTIHEKFLEMFSRELTISISTVFLLLMYIYIAWQGYEPSYLRESLKETIIAASNRLSSDCSVVNYILKLKIEIDSSFWWNIHRLSTSLESQSLKTILWLAFIFMNGLGILGLNRFIVQVIYLLNKLFENQGEDK